MLDHLVVNDYYRIHTVAFTQIFLETWGDSIDQKAGARFRRTAKANMA